MAKLTRNIVEDLNKQLEFMGCGWHYEFSDGDTYAPKMTIEVNGSKEFVYSSIINTTKTYDEWLYGWMKTYYDIDLRFNNTGSICWANDYT